MPVRARARSQDSGERAYVYAKTCGIIGKSFVGKRIGALARVNTLAELDQLVFPSATRELPGRELLIDLERRIARRAVRHMVVVINAYDTPPDLLVQQLRANEYADVKTCLHNMAVGKGPPPALSDLGRFGTVRFDAYPDLGAMLKGTEFEWIAAEKRMSADFDLNRIEARLDAQYYTLLVESLKGLSGVDRQIAQQVLAEEISLRNCVWALRLRVYYERTAEEAQGYLMDFDLPDDGGEADGGVQPRVKLYGQRNPLSAEARELLRLPLDSHGAWREWRWQDLLNPEESDRHWAADPRYFQNAAAQYMYRLSLKWFRRMPFSIGSDFCYIKLKQFEENLLTSVAEGLGLGMGSYEVFNLLEVKG